MAKLVYAAQFTLLSDAIESCIACLLWLCSRVRVLLKYWHVRSRHASPVLPMHYLDPAAPRATSPAPTKPAVRRDAPLHEILTKYEAYVAAGGSCDLSAWGRSNKLIPATYDKPLSLPLSIYKRSGARTCTPIQAILSGGRPSDQAMVRNVSEALHALDSCVEMDEIVVSEKELSSRRRLDFPDAPEGSSGPPPRDESPPTIVMDEYTPPDDAPVAKIGARAAQRLAGKRTVLEISYWLCCEIQADDFYNGNTFEPALICELVMLAALHAIPLTPSTYELSNAPAVWSCNPNKMRQREWEGRFFLDGAFARCERQRGMVNVRELAARIVAMRPPFAAAVAAHLFGRHAQSDAGVYAWLGAAQYAFLTPTWASADIHPMRKDFAAPYVTHEMLAHAPELMRRFRDFQGQDMTDHEAATFLALHTYALGVCREFDPMSLVTARKTKDAFVEARDIREYVRVWGEIAEFVRIHHDNVDAYVSPTTVHMALVLMDAQSNGETLPHGPSWYMFVRITAVIEKNAAAVAPLLFQDHYASLLLHRCINTTPCPRGISVTTVEVFDAATKFERLIDDHAYMDPIAAPTSQRIAVVVGKFLCAVYEAIRLSGTRVDARPNVLDPQLHMKAVIACVRSTYVVSGGTTMAHYIRCTAKAICSDHLAGVLMGVWDMWLPRFAESTLLCAARDAVSAPDFDTRARVPAVYDGSPLARFLHDSDTQGAV